MDGPVDDLSKYRGVKGWLLFLCISLTIINPLLALSAMGNSMAASQRIGGRIPGLTRLSNLEALLGLVQMSFSLCTGIFLWAVIPYAVKVAKAYFASVLGFYIINVILAYSLLPGKIVNASKGHFAITGVGTLTAVILWYSYLSRSKRVKATYGSPTSAAFAGENPYGIGSTSVGQVADGDTTP